VKFNHASVAEAHLGSGVALNDDLHAPGQKCFEFCIRNVVEMVIGVYVADKVGHRRPRGPDELIRYAPHFLEGPVDDPAAQVWPHEQHGVLDGFEHRIEMM
jgi:hypothetical protein